MPVSLTRKEVCAQRGIRRETLYRWECAGLRIIGGRVTMDVVLDFLAARDAKRRQRRKQTCGVT